MPDLSKVEAFNWKTTDSSIGSWLISKVLKKNPSMILGDVGFLQFEHSMTTWSSCSYKRFWYLS